jgi:hypothetical protein
VADERRARTTHDKQNKEQAIQYRVYTAGAGVGDRGTRCSLVLLRATLGRPQPQLSHQPPLLTTHTVHKLSHRVYTGCTAYIIIIIKRCEFAIPPTLVPRANGRSEGGEQHAASFRTRTPRRAQRAGAPAPGPRAAPPRPGRAPQPQARAQRHAAAAAAAATARAARRRRRRRNSGSGSGWVVYDGMHCCTGSQGGR